MSTLDDEQECKTGREYSALLRGGYETDLGKVVTGRIEDALDSDHFGDIRGNVQLIFTSPPFPLNNKKKYGNLTGSAYLEWFEQLAEPFTELLAPNGSIVIELGNSWEAGRPSMSTLALRSLLAFQERAELNLCQTFVWNNPARLPSPAAWVTVKRIRVKDAYTNIWWMSPSNFPKASNLNVLTPYKDSMRRLLEERKYNAGKRPSEHSISQESFFVDNGGAIPSNVLTYANTSASDTYLKYCRANDFEFHPARMPKELAEFFIKFLTEPGDTVVDPFAGSNTTGFVSESLGRRWIAVEADPNYVQGSVGRFGEDSVRPLAAPIWRD